MDGSLVILKGSSLLRFCYSNEWYPCHYGRQFIVEILLLQCMVALSLWKVVCRCHFCRSNGWQPCYYGRQFVVEIFVIPMDGSIVVMEASLLSSFLLLQWMVALSLWNVVLGRYLSPSVKVGVFYLFSTLSECWQFIVSERRCYDIFSFNLQ